MLPSHEEGYMKGKRLLLAAAVLVAVMLSSCDILIEGNAYIGYGWDDILESFYDDNPALPNIIVEDQYYRSETGEYFASYTINGFYGRRSAFFNYYIESDYTSLSDPRGISDTYFYIYLEDDGTPSIQEAHVYRSIDSGKSIDGTISKSIAMTASSAKVNRDSLGEPDGVIEKSQGGYTMHLEYWKIE